MALPIVYMAASSVCKVYMHAYVCLHVRVYVRMYVCM